jgi:hypothetical protein
MRQRNKPPSKQEQHKANSKAGQLVDYRDDLLNLKTTCKLKLPDLTEVGADQAVATKRQKKKNTTQPPGKTMTDLPLKYQQ